MPMFFTRDLLGEPGDEDARRSGADSGFEPAVPRYCSRVVRRSFQNRAKIHAFHSGAAIAAVGLAGAGRDRHPASAGGPEAVRPEVAGPQGRREVPATIPETSGERRGAPATSGCCTGRTADRPETRPAI